MHAKALEHSPARRALRLPAVNAADSSLEAQLMGSLASLRRSIAGMIGSPRVRAAALSAAALTSAVLAVPSVQSTPVGQMAAAVAAAPLELAMSVE